MWGEEQQKAFDELKARLQSASVLAHPDPSRQFILNTDASGFAVAAVLSQQQKDGSIRPVAYYSKKMNSAEKNYGVTDKELLAIVEAVRHWRCYLEGNPYPTKVHTDHQGLQWLNSKAELSGRQARWVESLSDLEYEVSYIPGPRNAAADALSRRADFSVRVIFISVTYQFRLPFRNLSHKSSWMQNRGPRKLRQVRPANIRKVRPCFS